MVIVTIRLEFLAGLSGNEQFNDVVSAKKMRVYLVENQANGKKYVGITTYSPEERLKQHLGAARCNSELHLHRAMRKHGENSFTIRELESCSDIETMKAREIHWIAELDTFNSGYNMTKGGDGLFGYRHTEEAKKSMSEKRSGKLNHNFGKAWGRTGPLSEKAKQKLSEVKTGVPVHNKESKAAIARSQYKKIIQYDLNGGEVARYNSMIEAEEKTGIGHTGISRCCREPHRTARGFKFRYDNEQKAQ